MASSGGSHSSSHPSTADGNRVAASNSTLNAFLGGRQPSWMTNAAPVNPTPRPPRLANLPPKSSPKPQVAHLPMQQARQPRLAHQAHRPRENQRQSPVIQGAAPVASQLPQKRQHPLPAEPAHTVITRASNPSTVLLSPAPSDEPSPALSISYEVTSPDHNRSVPPETTGLAPRAEARFVPLLSEDVPSIVATPSRPTSQTTLANGSIAPSETQVRTASRAPIPASAMSLQTPPTPSVPSFSPMTAPMSEVPNGAHGPLPKRRRTGNAPHPVLDSLQAAVAIDLHIASSGGEQSFDNFVERPRVQLLKEACHEGDLFFIALHQLFCVWSNNNGHAHNFCVEGLHDTNLVDNAFGLMGTILKSNSKIRPVHLQWFMNFPGHLNLLCGGGYPDYAKAIQQVLNFLVSLSQHWMVMNHGHRKLQYPLLMDELLVIFHLYSPILQAIVFRASRRTLGVMDGPTGTWMDEVFRQDQQAHRDADGKFFTRMTQDYRKEPHNQVLIKRYQSAVMYASQQNQQRVAQEQNAATLPRIQHQQHQNDQQRTITSTPQISHQTAQVTNSHVPGPNHNNALEITSIVPNHETTENAIYNSSASAASSWTSTSLTESDNFLNAVSGSYQFPSAQLPQYTETTPVQFPSVNPGQCAPSAGQPGPHGGAYVAGNAVRPSQPFHQGYPQHLQSQVTPRHTSQQFAQVPSTPNTLSPQMQHLLSLPPQLTSGRNSPSYAQNIGTQHPQASFSGRSSPDLQNVATRSVQSHSHRVSTSSASPAPKNATSSFMAAAATQAQQLQQMQQQQVQEQLMNHFRQSIVRPQPIANLLAQQNQQYQRAGAKSAPNTQNRVNRFPPIPPSEYPHDPYERKSFDMSLHQAHLRSPKRMPKSTGSSFKTTEKYFQSIKYLALQPTPIPQQQYLFHLKFNLSEETCSKISPDVLLHRDSLPVNMYSDRSLRVRLRCCFQKRDTTSISEGSWVLLDTAWPEHIYMQLNDKPLTLKRKQHHHKDQPVEIGSLVRPGENTLRLNVPLGKPIPNNMKAFIAVEVIETLIHDSVRKLPNLALESKIPSAETRAIIRKRLAGSLGTGNDEEIAMVVSDLTVNVADPFSCMISAVPVRGTDCTHLECFDLETWLETRPTKKHCVCGEKLADCTYCPREPSLIDKWKCPICQGDARPYSLRVDGFLLEVREALSAQDLLKTKAIVVSADGSWKPIAPDEDSDFESDDDNVQNAAAERRLQSSHFNRAPVEVITLEND